MAEEVQNYDRGSTSQKHLVSKTREMDSMVDGIKLNPVPEFSYLGSIISSDGRIEAEIQRRVAKASLSFGRLRQRLWSN